MALTKVTGGLLGNLPTGTNNVAVGDTALDSIASGATENVAIGSAAGTAITTGDANVALGYNALSADTAGNASIAIGKNALAAQNTSGDVFNTAVGFAAGAAITTGIQNTLIGGLAGDNITDADNNVAVGFKALSADTLGTDSVAIGIQALRDQNFTTATASYNIAIGRDAGVLITTGLQNTLIGSLAGDAITTGSSNVIIGYNNDVDTGGADVRFGLGVNLGLTAGNTIKIGNGSTFITNTWGSNATWTHSSDERLKENIQDATLGLSFINDLRTVNYNWRLQKDVPEEIRGEYESERDTEVRQHGLIAQEVKAALDKAGVDTFLGWSEEKDGTQMISEGMFVFPLIKAIQEQSALITSLTARVAELEG